MPWPVEFRAIPGHPGYRAGDDGSLWSCWRTTSRGHGKGWSQKISETWRPLKPKRSPDGYLSVTVNGKHRRVNRLVLAAFAGPAPDAKAQGRHLNGIRDDNRPCNLAWGTIAENRADSMAQGTIPRGSDHALAKLTECQVAQIRARCEAGETKKALARVYGVSRITVRRIIDRSTWAHIGRTA